MLWDFFGAFLFKKQRCRSKLAIDKNSTFETSGQRNASKTKGGSFNRGCKKFMFIFCRRTYFLVLSCFICLHRKDVFFSYPTTLLLTEQPEQGRAFCCIFCIFRLFAVLKRKDCAGTEGTGKSFRTILNGLSLSLCPPFSLVTCICMYIFVFALSALHIFSSPPLVF